MQTGVTKISCVQLNRKGTGPDDDAALIAAGFLAGSQIYGLPEEVRGRGLRC